MEFYSTGPCCSWVHLGDRRGCGNMFVVITGGVVGIMPGGFTNKLEKRVFEEDIFSSYFSFFFTSSSPTPAAKQVINIWLTNRVAKIMPPVPSTQETSFPCGIRLIRLRSICHIAGAPSRSPTKAGDCWWRGLVSLRTGPSAAPMAEGATPPSCRVARIGKPLEGGKAGRHHDESRVVYRRDIEGSWGDRGGERGHSIETPTGALADCPRSPHRP